ncbi:hypothetical protein EON81_11385 [bacterium]|nr:MAG: hypothetical protein EON81_11385 [bacterium]
MFALIAALSMQKGVLLSPKTPLLSIGETRASIQELGRLSPGTPGRQRKIERLISMGDPKAMLPFCLDVLKGFKRNPREMRTRYSASEREFDSALGFASNSNDPLTVRFLTEMLRGRRGDPKIWRLAYERLPAIGGKRGRAAVLDYRQGSRKLPPLSQRMGLSHLSVTPAPPFREQNVALIRTEEEWGLIEYPMLGDPFDLFVVRRQGGRWVDPGFTGTSLQNEWFDFSEENAVLSDSWFDVGEEHHRDADGDGLNEAAEERLGTNPNHSDTDEDGLPDAVDQNPLVAPRPLSREEEVLWTVFDAFCRFHSSDGPTLVFYPGQPFELQAGTGYILPSSGTAQTRLGRGTAFVSLKAPKIRGDFATVDIGFQGDPLGGAGHIITLRRFDGHWFVVKRQSTWIS